MRSRSLSSSRRAHPERDDVLEVHPPPQTPLSPRRGDNGLRAQRSVPNIRGVAVPDNHGHGRDNPTTRRPGSSASGSSSQAAQQSSYFPIPTPSPRKGSYEATHGHVDTPIPRPRSRSVSDTRAKTKVRPRAPPTPSPRLPTSATSSPFMPPSHFAAAAGLSYPLPKPRSESDPETTRPTAPPLSLNQSQRMSSTFLKNGSDSMSVSSHASSLYPSSISTLASTKDSPFPFLPVSSAATRYPQDLSSRPRSFLIRSLSSKKSKCTSAISLVPANYVNEHTPPQRASQYGLPTLETNLLPSLRDTVDRMTQLRNPEDPTLRRVSFPIPSPDPQRHDNEDPLLTSEAAMNSMNDSFHTSVSASLASRASLSPSPHTAVVSPMVRPRPHALKSTISSFRASPEQSPAQARPTPHGIAGVPGLFAPGRGIGDENQPPDSFRVSLRTTKRLATSVDQAPSSMTPQAFPDPPDATEEMRTPRAPATDRTSPPPATNLPKKKSGIPIRAKVTAKATSNLPTGSSKSVSSLASMAGTPSSSSISDSASSVFKRFLLRPGWSFRGGIPIASQPNTFVSGSEGKAESDASEHEQGLTESYPRDGDLDQPLLPTPEIANLDAEDADSIRSSQDEGDLHDVFDSRRHARTPSMDEGNWSGDETHRERRKALVGLVKGLGLGFPEYASRIYDSQNREIETDRYAHRSDDLSWDEPAHHELEHGYLSPTWLSHGRQSITPTPSPRHSRAEYQNMLLGASPPSPATSQTPTHTHPARTRSPENRDERRQPSPSRLSGESKVILTPRHPGPPPPIPPRPASLTPRTIESRQDDSPHGHWKDHIQLTTSGYRGSILVPERERAAYGIPPSASDIRHSVIAMSHADSDMSSVGELLKQEDKEQGFSDAAEALFDTISLKTTGYRVSIGDRTRSSAHSLPESVSSRSSLSEESSDVSNYEEELPNLDDVPDQLLRFRESWRSAIGEAQYNALCTQYGAREMARQAIIWELCESEQVSLKELQATIKHFVLPLKAPDRSWVPGLPTEVARLFDWLEDIVHLHACIADALLDLRTAQHPVICTVADTLRPFIPRMEVYQPYIVTVDSLSLYIQQMIDDPGSDFGEYARLQMAAPDGPGIDLLHSLSIPVQRLERYQTYFEMLLDHTPPRHPDYLSSVSLFHSGSTLIRVMKEVKSREDEYAAIKRIAANIEGLPPALELARRERRLLAQGLLYVLPTSRGDRPTQSSVARPNSQTRIETVILKRNSSFDSLDAQQPDTAQYAIATRYSARRRSRSFDSLAAPSTTQTPLPGERAIHAFVFTDLILLTVPTLEAKDQERWRLLEHDSMLRILDLRVVSGIEEERSIIEIDVLPLDLEKTKMPTNTITANTIAVRVPGTGEDRARWLSALRRCLASVLQSLSYPYQSGSYLAHGLDADLQTDTRLTVKSLLAAGLPFPKSPSLQQEDLQLGRPPEHVLEEREERGWWALRFQQVLREVQRRESSMVGTFIV